MKLSSAQVAAYSARTGLSVQGGETPGGVVFRGQIIGEALMLNGMYANVPGKGRVLTSKAKAWKKAAKDALAYTCIADTRPLFTDARLHLSLTIYGRWETKAGQPLKKDADGTIKAAQDVLCEYLGIDDRRIYRVEAQKVHTAPEQARIELVLRVLPTEGRHE